MPTFAGIFAKVIPMTKLKLHRSSDCFLIIFEIGGAIRSIHPFFSFSGIGPHAQSLFSGISKSSFGPESVFDRLMQRAGN